MERFFDEFSKSLAASVPRRDMLRRTAAVLAGAALTPLGLGTAWARTLDPCKAFCKCSKGKQQTQCLDACHACNGNTSRLGGSCGSYVCCSTASCGGVCSDLRSDPNCGACGNDCAALGETCCGGYCADLANDVNNCGTCGVPCAAPGPYETVGCVSGSCFYSCVNGAADCGSGACTYLGSDPNNCGACGNLCGGSTPYCSGGQCTDCAGGAVCNGVCTDLLWDSSNCGACGNVCPDQFACSAGVCEGICYNCY